MDFLCQIEEKQTNLQSLLNLKPINIKLQQFLTDQDKFSLQLTCKQLLSQIYIKKQKNQKQKDPEFWKKKILNQKSVKYQKNQDLDFKLINDGQQRIIKAKYNKIPKEYFNKENWKIINKNDKIIQQKVTDEKFLVENQNIFFKNVKNNEIFFINRSLLDEKLNFGQKNWTDPEEEKNQFEFLSDNQSLDPSHYDFTNPQSLLQRQKDLIAQIQSRTHQKELDSLPENCLSSLQNLQKICLILCCGGYFAMGIFENGKCIIHKSDHKYVVRKKAGQRQINKEKVGNSFGSVGSQIRREQENHHWANIKQILIENYSMLEQSDIIFLQAPGINKLILSQDDFPLFKLKHKLRSLCISSKKAKYTEIERLYKAISKVYIVLDEQK